MGDDEPTIAPDKDGQRKFAVSLVKRACVAIRKGSLSPDDELRVRRQLSWALRRASELGFTTAVELAARAKGVILK